MDFDDDENDCSIDSDDGKKSLISEKGEVGKECGVNLMKIAKGGEVVGFRLVDGLNYQILDSISTDEENEDAEEVDHYFD